MCELEESQMPVIRSIKKKVHTVRTVMKVFRGIRKITGHKKKIARAGTSVAGAIFKKK